MLQLGSRFEVDLLPNVDDLGISESFYLEGDHLNSSLHETTAILPPTSPKASESLLAPQPILVR